MFAEAKYCMDGPQRRIGPQCRIGLIRSREQLGESIMLCFEADTTRHGCAFVSCDIVHSLFADCIQMPSPLVHKASMYKKNTAVGKPLLMDVPVEPSAEWATISSDSAADAARTVLVPSSARTLPTSVRVTHFGSASRLESSANLAATMSGSMTRLVSAGLDVTQGTSASALTRADGLSHEVALKVAFPFEMAKGLSRRYFAHRTQCHQCHQCQCPWSSQRARWMRRSVSVIPYAFRVSVTTHCRMFEDDDDDLDHLLPAADEVSASHEEVLAREYEDFNIAEEQPEGAAHKVCLPAKPTHPLVGCPRGTTPSLCAPYSSAASRAEPSVCHRLIDPLQHC